MKTIDPSDGREVSAPSLRRLRYEVVGGSKDDSEINERAENVPSGEDIQPIATSKLLRRTAFIPANDSPLKDLLAHTLVNPTKNRRVYEERTAK
jgi:hypothetical protein